MWAGEGVKRKETSTRQEIRTQSRGAFVPLYQFSGSLRGRGTLWALSGLGLATHALLREVLWTSGYR